MCALNISHALGRCVWEIGSPSSPYEAGGGVSGGGPSHPGEGLQRPGLQAPRSSWLTPLAAALAVRNGQTCRARAAARRSLPR